MPWKPDYVSEDELREYARITDLEDDTLLALANSASARAVDRHTHRQFGKVDASQERRYTARWNRRRCVWVVSVDDLQNTVGLTVTVAGVAATVTAEPVNAAADGRPYERLVIDPAVSVGKPTGLDNEIVATTDKWGWASVPAPVKQAALLQASRFNWRRDAPAGVSGSPDLGSEIRLLSRVDADLTPALSDFVRDRVVAR